MVIGDLTGRPGHTAPAAVRAPATGPGSLDGQSAIQAVDSVGSGGASGHLEAHPLDGPHGRGTEQRQQVTGATE